MSEHSPAPWIFIEDENYSRTITDSYGDTIMQEAKRYHLQRTPAKLADWKLIAAAPETAAERDRLREVNAELLAVLKAHEKWEADLILCNAAWEPNGEAETPRITPDLWDKLLEIMAMRNAAIAKAEGK